MTIWKKLGIVGLVIGILICAVIDGTWFYVYFFAPQKEVVNTFKWSTITTKPSDGEVDEDGNPVEPQTEYVIKIKYFSNENNNGVEAFEIQFNDFVDEKQNKIYSQGIQFVANSTTDKLDWQYNFDKPSIKYTGHKYYFPNLWQYNSNVFGSYAPTNGTISYYQSDNNFETTFSNSEDFSNNGFTITLKNDKGEDEIYMLKFNRNKAEDTNYVTRKIVNSYRITVFYRHVDMYYYYWNYDVYALARIMYDNLQATANGVHSAHLFELNNLFKYSKYNGKSYEAITDTDIKKVTTLNETYAGIYVEKTADGLQRATDSIFNAVNNSAQYNNQPEGTEDFANQDYIYGKNAIPVTIYDFDLMKVSGNYYVLKLKDEFVDKYYNIKSTIMLNIELDLDVLQKQDIQFAGFTSNSGLNDFSVYSCKTFTTVNGEKVYSEVNLC